MDKKWFVLLSTGMMIVLVNFDATIVNLALATIAKTMTITLTQMQWVINIYLLCAAILFVVGGRLAQIYGKRRIFLVGVGFFFLGSLIAGSSNLYSLLLAGRFLQGIGFAFTLGLSLVMTLESFPPKQRGLAVGVSITLTGTAQALGPTIGGVILQWLSWHWIFLMNLPLCLLSFFMTRWAYPPDKPTHSHEQIDKTGVFILCLSLGLVLTAINNIHIWTLLSSLTLLAIGLILLVFFYFFEKKQPTPLVNFSLFSNRNFTLSTLIRIIFMYGWTMLLFILPLFLQNIQNYHPLAAGLWILCMSIMLGIVSPVAGLFLDRIGFQIPTLASMILAGICFLFLCFISADDSFWLFATTLFLYGIAAGLNIPSTFNGVMVSVEKSVSSLAVGMFFTLTFVGSSLTVALSGVQLNWISSSKLHLELEKLHAHFSQAQMESLNQLANGTQNMSDFKHAFSPDQLNVLSQITKSSFMQGFHSLTLVNLLLTLIGIGLCFSLTKVVD